MENQTAAAPPVTDVQMQQAQPQVMQQIQQALAGLAHHEFDPTMRQLMAQVMHQEQAGGGAAMALQAAAAALVEKDRTINELLARIEALEAQQAKDADPAAQGQADGPDPAADPVAAAAEARIAEVVRDFDPKASAARVTKQLNGSRP